MYIIEVIIRTTPTIKIFTKAKGSVKRRATQKIKFATQAPIVKTQINLNHQELLNKGVISFE